MSPSPFDAPRPTALTLRDKIAQLIFVRIGSKMQSPCTVEQDEERVARLLDKCCIGGLALFNGGPETRQALDRLQQRAKMPLLVGSDVERGVGQQVNGYTLFPHAMAFGKLPVREGDRAVDRFAEVLAHEAWSAGIHITFGPVADVCTNPKNPIIATRAFHEDPQRAAALVDRFVRRVQACGLHATAKHFPGHGDTDLDSHATLPHVGKTREELESCELLPFHAAIAAECHLIMTAHVAYPAFDRSETPATLSPMIVNKLLREEMGFDGVVCTDSLQMAGVRDQFASEGEMALAALNAGVDLLLDVRDPLTVVDHLCRCVDDGRLDLSQIDASLLRIWKLKDLSQNRRGLAGHHRCDGRAESSEQDVPVPLSVDDFGIGPKTMQPCFSWEGSSGRTASSIASQAIQVVRKTGDAMTVLNRTAPLAAILLTPFEIFAADVSEQPLAAALREQFPDVKYAQLGPSADMTAYNAANEFAREAKQLLVAVVVRPAAWHAFGLRPEQNEFVRALLKQRRDVVLVSLGVPSILNEFPDAAISICTYSDVPASQQAVAEFLLGKREFAQL